MAVGGKGPGVLLRLAGDQYGELSGSWRQTQPGLKPRSLCVILAISPPPPFLWALIFHPQNKPERSFLKALSADTKIFIISQNLVLLCFSLLMTM